MTRPRPRQSMTFLFIQPVIPVYLESNGLNLAIIYISQYIDTLLKFFSLNFNQIDNVFQQSIVHKLNYLSVFFFANAVYFGLSLPCWIISRSSSLSIDSNSIRQSQIKHWHLRMSKYFILKNRLITIFFVQFLQ